MGSETEPETPSYGEIPEFRQRLMYDAGFFFTLGAAGGSAFHFVRGLCTSPYGGCLAAGARAARASAPRVAGRFGAYGAALSVFDHAMSLARRKEDPWNAVAAGAAAFGALGMGRGVPAAARSALLGATAIAAYVGAEIFLYNKILGETPQYRPLPLRQKCKR